MLDRVRLVRKGLTKAGTERTRSKKNVRTFTDLWISKKLKLPKEGQELFWDEGCRGLSLLVSSGGTKTFRATFKLNSKWISHAIGRYGEVVADSEGKEDANISWARETTRTYRALANDGIDPRRPATAEQEKPKPTFEYVVDQFIEHYAKPQQHTWDQTERILKRNCAGWLKRPIDDIPPSDVRSLLRGFISDGHVYKAAITRAWLKKLWRWAFDEEYTSSPVIRGIDNIKIEKRQRDRVYTDDEIKATWKAADKIGGSDGAFMKLLILLAPRKTALASMRRRDLDDPADPTLWTTPSDQIKRKKSTSKARVYLTPLPPLAQRILKSQSKRDDNCENIFPNLPVHMTKAGRGQFHGRKLVRSLVDHGAPKDLQFHAWRHTIATWLENQGYSEWERGLALNHSDGGSVTAGYSHGYPLDLKRTILTKWAEHVEKIVAADGVAVLR